MESFHSLAGFQKLLILRQARGNEIIGVAGGLRVEVCQDRNRASSCFCRETQNSPALNLSLTITSYASFHKSSKVLIRSENRGSRAD